MPLHVHRDKILENALGSRISRELSNNEVFALMNDAKALQLIRDRLAEDEVFTKCIKFLNELEVKQKAFSTERIKCEEEICLLVRFSTRIACIEHQEISQQYGYTLVQEQSS